MRVFGAPPPDHELIAPQADEDGGNKPAKPQVPGYPAFMQWALMVGAVIYLWSLPSLRGVGFTNTCATNEYNGDLYSYPYCLYDFWFLGYDFKVCSGASVSDFIAQPQATGLLAALLFWSCLHLWLPGDYVVGKAAYTSLLFFQIFFGAFLSCPVTRWPTMHLAVVQVFCVAGMVHMLIMLGHSSDCMTTMCAWTSIIGFLGVVCTGLLSLLVTPGFCHSFPYAFYCFEALGLSGMTLFVLFWREPGCASPKRS
mmetsp:Transcript_57348/g.114925  ORF Transcript_57348/g.114925 Transcript_57348/m.114925 type:complete len:254 (-) Transcript_57348:85-846(-)